MQIASLGLIDLDVRNFLNKVKTDSVIVPGGCTKYIQAPDVSWNKLFKAFITEQYDEWISKDLHEYTKAGNLKAPPRRQIVEWIMDAWEKFPKDSIEKSFKRCGLNLP